jgi:predicted PurR-regulated permease PerM
VNSLNLSGATRWGLNLLVLLAIIAALWLGQTIFIPTVISLLLAAMLWPGTSWLNKKLHVPWGIACTIVIGCLVVLNLLVSVGFALAITRIVQKLPNPNDIEAQAQVYTAIRDRLEQVSPLPLDNNYLPREAQNSGVFQYVRQMLEKGDVSTALRTIAVYGNSWFWQWVLIMFVLLFLLLEGRMLTRRVVEIFGPSRQVQTKVIDALTDMAHQVRTYLVWRTIVNFSLGIVLGVVYSALGLQQAWTWALLTAVLCYVPYLGPIAAGVPPILEAFISSPNPWTAVVILVFYIGIITLEGYVIVPVVMGRSMEMNATTVMLACLFWELVWGPLGLFLAMPLMAAIKAICYHMPGLRPWANLMGTQDVEDLPDEQEDEDSDATASLRASDMGAPTSIQSGLATNGGHGDKIVESSTIQRPASSPGL